MLKLKNQVLKTHKMKRNILQNSLKIVIFLLLIFCSKVVAQNTQTFVTSGSFIVPAGVTQISVEVWGAGGAGGGATGNPSAGGGGAAGAYTKNATFAVISGNTYTVNVGAGGVGSTNAGTAGGNSWFGSATTLMAVGGSGGARSTANATGALGGVAVVTGNIGGTTNFYGGAGGIGGALGVAGGGGGGSAGTAANGNAGLLTVGGVAVTGGGFGVNGSATDANGLSNTSFGSGGAGAHTLTATDRLGGSGSNGKVIVSWVCPTYSLSSTTAASVCSGSKASVVLSSPTSNLPIGSYNVTYNLSGSNVATAVTSVMTVSTAGTGSFLTGNLASSGLTTIKITNISSGGTSPNNCNIAQSINNITSFAVNPVPVQPSILIGNLFPCEGSTQTYSVPFVTDETYNWVFPNGWSQLSGSNSNVVTVFVGTSNGNITITPSNSCGNGSSKNFSITSVVIPNKLGGINGNNVVCSGSIQSYNVSNVNGNIYNWTFPSDWVQISGGNTNAITVVAGIISGNIKVTVSNDCGTGPSQTLIVTTSGTPAQPSVINGPTTICQGYTVNYNVTNTPGLTYNWVLPLGWTQILGSNTNSVTVIIGASSGTIQVTSSNGCSSALQSLSVTVLPTPSIVSTTPGSRVDIGTVVLGATATGGIISWFDSLTGGTVLATGNSFTTPVIVATTTYFIEVSNGGCTTTPRVAVSASISAPEISVSGNGFNIADEDNTPITTDFTDLGTSNVGVSVTRTYTVQNNGTLNLTTGIISITGANAADFVVITNPSAIILPGGSSTFSIRFTPSAIGPRAGNLSFVTNDYDENPFNFVISGTGGTGQTPEINIQGLGVTIVDGDSGPLLADGTDFGSALVSSTITRTFTIQNTGAGPLVLTGFPIVVLSGSSNFVVSSQPSSDTIPSGGSLTFQIKFSPLTTGSSIALVTINNTDDNESIYDFVISGSAIVAGVEIDIQGNEVSIADGDITPSVNDQTDFGITDLSTPISLPFNVYSFGTLALTLNATITITGANAAMFTATALPTTLASSAITSFVVRFSPTSLGIKTATINIISNDVDETIYNFDIKAEVQNAAVLNTAPGGVKTNLKFWLKADSNIGGVVDNMPVSTWTDQTIGSTKTAVAKFAKEPKFQNNANDNVNFNPVIKFNGANTMSGNQGFNNADMFIVIRPTSTISSILSPQDVYCGDDVATNQASQDVTGFEIGNTSARHTNELIAYNQGAQTSYGVAEISTTKTYNGVNIFNPRKSALNRMEILANGATLTTAEVLTATYKDIPNSRYWLGRSEFFDASYIGDMLEIINYSVKNSDPDNNKIQSYLAIKYGITLGVNGVSQNYVNSNGNIIYSANAGFNYNIAGIGRDDNAGLIQKQSKTENTIADITIGLKSINETNSANPNAFDIDKNFLVWGSNNGTLVAQPAVTVNMSAGIPGLTTNVEFISIGRTWRVVETGGDIKTVKISVPSTMLTATITPPGDFLMFVSSSPIFDPGSEYRVLHYNGSKLEADFDFTGVKYITFGYAPEKTFERAITFDGIDDYLDAGNVLDLNTTFTVSAWIKRNSRNRSIVSKRDAGFVTGYDFGINNNGNLEMSWVNGTQQTITSNTIIPLDKWHNVAVTFDGNVAKMYIDGVLETLSPLLPVLSSSESFLIAAADALNTTSFFNGSIDEVRVFDIDLSQSQLQFVMNQELLKHSDNTITGSILPQSITLNEVKTIPWSNLKAYYPMSTYTYTNTKDKSNNDYTAALRNLITVDRQTAPLPYQSAADGTWFAASTWANSDIQDLPNSLSIVDGITPIKWNIAKTNHNIDSDGNKILLGLYVNSGVLQIKNDTKLQISHYLKLDGKIDLVDKSQLIQTTNSDLEVDSAGFIERDQQGHGNLYNYNHWCSPVSLRGTTSNLIPYSINDVFKDGTDPNNPLTINWILGLNAIPSSPISIAKRWINKFQNLSNTSANWTLLDPFANIQAGMGFITKGSAASTLRQNYTFVGKPNNGTISLPVNPGNLNLTGNPYPSALDSVKFLNDNAGTLYGVLYFWEHFDTNFSHVLSQYQAGQATRTLVGGAPAISSNRVSGLGYSGRVPSRYVPVGQGFFVTGDLGGTFSFNNGQRLFIKEDNVNSNPMFRKGGTKKPKVGGGDHDDDDDDDEVPTTIKIDIDHNMEIPLPPNPQYVQNAQDHEVENTNDEAVNDGYARIRLGYTGANNYHRQLLMGFMNEKASHGYDQDYDGVLFDNYISEMYFLIGTSKYVIMGEGFFDDTIEYPIGIKTLTGNVHFNIDEMTNFDDNQEVYIYDSFTGIYHDIVNNNFDIFLEAGNYVGRFSLRFKVFAAANKQQKTVDPTVAIVFTNADDTLTIHNQTKAIIKTVSLFTILGQNITTWNVEEQHQSEIEISIKNYQAGTYIVKMQTETESFTKKIIIK